MRSPAPCEAGTLKQNAIDVFVHGPNIRANYKGRGVQYEDCGAGGGTWFDRFAERMHEYLHSAQRTGGPELDLKFYNAGAFCRQARGCFPREYRRSQSPGAEISKLLYRTGRWSLRGRSLLGNHREGSGRGFRLRQDWQVARCWRPDKYQSSAVAANS